MPQHKEIFPAENHIVHSFEYANAAARIGATGLLPADLNKVALQQDDNSLWLLIDDSPVTWEPIGGGSAGIVDHGALSGLGDDDHTQYLTETRHDGLPSDNPHGVTAVQAGADPAGTAAAAVSSHEAAADPHTQYLTEARHDGLPSDNPHGVTAVQAGADPAGTAAATVSSHEAAADPHTQYLTEARHDGLPSDNPHTVTVSQVLTADSGTDATAAELEQLTDGSNADTLHSHAPIGGADHGGLTGLGGDDHAQYLTETRHDALPADNPHSVTAVQAGADPAGTAATAVSSHEASGTAHAAEDITYSNTTSGLSATDTQAAIDEVEGRVDANDAKVSADGSVNTHSDVDVSTITPVEGHGLAFDGSTWVPSFVPFSLASGRAASATDIWLRSSDGVPLNISPFRLPFDAKLVGIAATTLLVATWECEVHTNAVVRAGGVPTNGSEISQLAISAATGGQVLVNIDLAAGDEVGVFCRGTSIPGPHAILYLVRRA